MADLALLMDCGSTYTKVVAVDLAAQRILATGNALTTVDTDVNLGIREAVSALLSPEATEWKVKLACSSAAGGLRMVALGLAPDMTTEAARNAALGAGARVARVFSYRLSPEDLEALRSVQPDVVLLSGGTDGGDIATILHNAAMLTRGRLTCPVVYAGNAKARAEAARLMQTGGLEVLTTENVLPEPRKLNILPAREVIRRLFAERIIEAKGMKKLRAFVDREVLPTPAAVQNAAQLLAEGHGEERGLGDLLLVDVGGATTDVHSIAGGSPTQLYTVLEAESIEPKIKRTVEGDLGMRVSARSLVEAAGPRRLNKKAGLSLSPDQQRSMADQLVANVGRLPDTDEARAFDLGMARCAVDLAVQRHVGHVDRVPTPTGTLFVQEGKDLSEVRYVIGTGGVLAFGEDSLTILAEATTRRDIPSLKPRHADLLIDRDYLLWAMGLLSQVDPVVTLRILKRHVGLGP